MTALWISLGILLGLLFLMICPVAVTADFREKLEIKVRYLCFTYQVAPQKKKPKKAKQKQPESKKKGATGTQEIKISGNTGNRRVFQVCWNSSVKLAK